MTQSTVTCPLKYLRAMQHFVSSEETRRNQFPASYYLHGIFIDPAPTPHLVATDGHVLGVLHAGENIRAEGPPLIWKVGPMLKAISEAKLDRFASKNILPWITLTHDESGTRAEIRGGFESIAGIQDAQAKPCSPPEVIDGTFPDWRRALKASISESTASRLCVNPEQLLRVQKAYETIFSAASSPELVVTDGAESPLYFHHQFGAETMFGAVMPMPAVSNITWEAATGQILSPKDDEAPRQPDSQ